ncbi:MAG: hypothetical protein KZQ93_09585 [Candidatus Thiodiazotropha sp. (ex Monitilora ramsayi)]|nr:hypothetical protein [Candidatus Thiodiazotropha sp. (ex Monitilora ramsayi)]
MNSWIRRHWPILLVLGVLASTLGFLNYAFQGIFSGATECDEDSRAVRYVRSLPEDRFARLYKDMESYSEKDIFEYENFGSNTFPDEFNDLEVVRIRPKDGNIMVNGCFDHYVYLEFHGLGRGHKRQMKPAIQLRWGEGPTSGTEIVWQE